MTGAWGSTYPKSDGEGRWKRMQDAKTSADGVGGQEDEARGEQKPDACTIHSILFKMFKCWWLWENKNGEE